MIKRTIEKLIKRLKWYDMSLIKGSVLFFTLFLMTAWSDFNSLVMSIHWGYFLALFIIFAIPVMRKVF